MTDEYYTLSQLGDIFDVELKEVKRWFKKKQRIFPRTKNTKVSILQVIVFLRENPSHYTHLCGKHDRLMRMTKNEEEQTIRHILMTYMYYVSNGYLE